MPRLTRKQRRERDAARFARMADAAHGLTITLEKLEFAALNLSLGMMGWTRRPREKLTDGLGRRE